MVTSLTWPHKCRGEVFDQFLMVVAISAKAHTTSLKSKKLTKSPGAEKVQRGKFSFLFQAVLGLSETGKP